MYSDPKPRDGMLSRTASLQWVSFFRSDGSLGEFLEIKFFFKTIFSCFFPETFLVIHVFSFFMCFFLVADVFVLFRFQGCFSWPPNENSVGGVFFLKPLFPFSPPNLWGRFDFRFDWSIIFKWVGKTDLEDPDFFLGGIFLIWFPTCFS